MRRWLQILHACIAGVRACHVGARLLELGDLLVVHDRRVVGVAHVEQLATQREDAIVVTADDGEARDGESLGGVALCDDQRALVPVLAARLVGVVKLRDARDTRRLLAVRLLHLLRLLLLREREDRLEDAAAERLPY